MKIAVMGAGSVGCYFGGMLARAGHDVTLVARAAHVQAICRDGLLLDTQTFREHVQVRADSDAGSVRQAELVLFCVKSIDTATAAASLAPHLAHGATVPRCSACRTGSTTRSCWSRCCGGCWRLLSMSLPR